MAEHLQAKKNKVSGHLQERNGIFYMMLNWIDEAGNRGRKAISTRLTVKGNKGRAAEMLYLARKEQEALLLNLPGIDDMLFSDFMEEWLEAIRPEVKPTTFGGYQLNVQKAIVPYFKQKRTLLRELTAEDINDFYKEQLKRVKAMTVHKYHANISKALKYAVQKNFIPHSVMDRVKRPKLDRFVGKFLKQSETVELFEAVKGHRLELGVIFGAFYGLRRSEVVGLRWESINFEANTITIEHTVTVASIDGKTVIIADDTTKSKSSYRTLPLVPAIRSKLLEIQAEQEKNRKLCGKAYNKAEGHYVYTDALGNRIKPDYISGEFPKFLTKHGFRRIRFHDLRHSCASLLLANGVPLKAIQEWLGHSTFAITADIYAHMDFNSKIASADAMKWIDSTSLARAFEQAALEVEQQLHALEDEQGEKPETTGFTRV
ncbi:MAG: site-specific integrase [Oscillospiraceae bacterium]|jgi:integrase|nr:site-specific integrase [Oscillospiraceae bacterium]